jgi:hypothetical protein
MKAFERRLQLLTVMCSVTVAVMLIGSVITGLMITGLMITGLMITGLMTPRLHGCNVWFDGENAKPVTR